MKSLARWAMSRRLYAFIAVAGTLMVPLLFWIGGALSALIIMRQGVKDGGRVVLWASLPAIAWSAIGDSTALITVIGASLIAVVLRNYQRLDWALLLATGLGVMLFALLPLLYGDVLTAVISEIEGQIMTALTEQPDMAATVQPMVAPVVSGGLAALHVIICILCLFLGRYWQSELYNPKGFGREFNQLRLPLAYSLPAAGLVLFAGALQPSMVGVSVVATVPLFFAGLAVFHGVVSKTRTSSNWLAVLYVAVLVFEPYMYTLLIFVALLDSLTDIRARLKDTAEDE